MGNELTEIREQIIKAKVELNEVVHKNLVLLIESSDKSDAYGNKYITADVFDYEVMVLRDGKLMFVDQNLVEYNIDNGDCSVDDFMDIIRIECERRDKNNREVRLREQYELAQEVVNKSGINIVTCGNCGDVNLHRIFPTESDEDITCARCGFESEPCDFPDLFH